MFSFNENRTVKEKMTVNFETFTDAVDEVLPNYHGQLEKRLCSAPFFKVKRKTPVNKEAMMQSEKAVRIDSGLQLWDIALHSALREISPVKYPHRLSIQIILNYILNDYGNTDYGLATKVLSRLLTEHPPSAPYMTLYYLRILEDRFAQIYDEKVEDEMFFWLVIDNIKNLPVLPKAKTDYQKYPPEDEKLNYDFSLEALKELKSSGSSCKKSVIFHHDLEPLEKEKRSIFCLQFICDILQDDLFPWLREFDSTRRIPGHRSLLAKLIWPNIQQEGRMTPLLRKIVALQSRCLYSETAVNISCERLLALTAELVRSFDRLKKRTYPFINFFSLDLARELGFLLVQRYEEPNVDIISYLNRLKPEWLRLETVCQVMGNLAGFPCPSETASAVTVLEHLEQVFKAGRMKKRKMEQENSETPQADNALIEKFSKLKSVNSLFRSGLSRLHTACIDNNVEAVRALLTFPTLDLNIADQKGWTPLHVAASRGSELCVRELLWHLPRVGDNQRRVDTRAQGLNGYTPLMQAVVAANVGICSALLQHTGSVLLEDINDDNLTALDLCKDDKVKALLMKYKESHVETIYSRRELNLETGNLQLVAQLCCCLVHSYMAVHQTWDVYQAVKRQSKLKQKLTETPPRMLCEYSRYFRDFKTNVPKLRQMVMKLSKVPQLQAIVELKCIVALNKD